MKKTTQKILESFTKQGDKQLERTENQNVSFGTHFRTWINSREEVLPEEVNTLPSMTMPNEALTVRQIIERYAQGIPVSQNTDGYYDDPDDMDMSDFDNLDFFEKMQYILDNKEYIKQLEERVEQESLKQQAPEGQDDRTVVDPPTENK